jgi:uncharacterized membrane protein affecting hemolysin expression
MSTERSIIEGHNKVIINSNNLLKKKIVGNNRIIFEMHELRIISMQFESKMMMMKIMIVMIII